ncbi:RNA-binding protein [Cucumibacter marinus]|uniref:RNA-binding protein n=1 Tax=Cucumibacter marinus TaxID=1121252 RepID=UPI00040A471F|nr:RNA-binding protein [Cucumibacter marinus]
MPKRGEIERQCCVTRQSLPAADMVRFAVGPDGSLAPDIDNRAGGRGAWVTLDQARVDEAVRRNAFARALKSPVSVPSDLANLTRARLEQRLLGALGLARKAGQLVMGAAKTEAAIAAGTVLALITASDARPDGRRKILAVMQRAGRIDHTPHIESFSSDRLGLALGGENVIHAALIDGAAAKTAVDRYHRLARYTATTDESVR